MQAKSFAATAVIVVPTFPEALRHPTDQLFEGAKTLTLFRHRVGIQDLSAPLLELLWGLAGARRINGWPSRARAYACRFWWPTIDTKRKLSTHPPYTSPKLCESKIHSQTFFRGLRASGDEKKFGIKNEILKRPPMYDANVDIEMIKTIPIT